MTAYELSEKKSKILRQIEYLKQEISCSNTETILLSNDEVLNIIENLNECIETINESLKKVAV